MKLDIPFNKAYFLKSLFVVAIGTALFFGGAIFLAGYEPTSADPWCAPIAAVLLAYFIHLMLWDPSKSD